MMCMHRARGTKNLELCFNGDASRIGPEEMLMLMYGYTCLSR